MAHVVNDDTETENTAATRAFAETAIYANYPFLTDKATVKHIKNSNVFFLMRGLPGSGKTTLVEKIKDKYPRAIACSADDYFLQRDGTYQFDHEKLSKAHASCQQSARNACTARKGVIIIDNTNVRRWEMENYVGLASECGYTVIVVMPDTLWRFDAEFLSWNNKHQVPREMLETKVKTFERALPVYWGWFLNMTDTDYMLRLAEKYYEECVAHVTEFASYVPMTRSFRGFDTTMSRSTFRSRYHRQGFSSEPLHCTAYFGGPNHSRSDSSNASQTQTSSYVSRPAVQRAMGRAYKLSIVGFVITPRTVGARLRLSKRQLKLWAKDDLETPPSKYPEENSDKELIMPQEQVDKHAGEGSSRHGNQPDDAANTGFHSNKGSSKKSEKNRGEAWKAADNVKTNNPFAMLEESASSDENSTDEDSDLDDDLEEKTLDKDKALSQQGYGPGTKTNVIDKDLTSKRASDDSQLPDIKSLNIADCDDAAAAADEDVDVFDTGKKHPRFRPLSGFGSRAHLTLGFSAGTQAIQTGYDLIEVVQCEEQSLDSSDHVTVDGGVVRYYDEGRCMVYLDEDIRVWSLFSGRY